MASARCAYTIAPSGSTWKPVEDYIEKDTRAQNTEEGPTYIDHYKPEDFVQIILTQHKVSGDMEKSDYTNYTPS